MGISFLVLPSADLERGQPKPQESGWHLETRKSGWHLETGSTFEWRATSP